MTSPKRSFMKQTKEGWSVSRLSQPSHHCQGRKFPVQCSSAVVSWSSALIVPTMHSVLCILPLKDSSCIIMLLYRTTLEGNWQYCRRNRVYNKHYQKKGIGTDTVTGTVRHCYCLSLLLLLLLTLMYSSRNIVWKQQWYSGMTYRKKQWYSSMVQSGTLKKAVYKRSNGSVKKQLLLTSV